MLAFPENFDRKSCIDKMTSNQKILIKSTRQDIYDNIIKFSDECNTIMTIDLPDKLWHEHKLTLIGEILERFGKIKIKIISGQIDVTKVISDIKDVPINVKKIIIEFPVDS
jgi:hypothetical protein